MWGTNKVEWLYKATISKAIVIPSIIARYNSPFLSFEMSAAFSYGFNYYYIYPGNSSDS